MIAAAVLGVVFAGGLCLILSGLVPAKATLADAIAQLDRPPDPPARPASLDERLARRLPAWVDPNRFGARRRSRDLRVLEIDPTTFVASKLFAALIATLISPALSVIAVIAGMHVAWQLPVLGAAGLGIAAYFVPDLDVHTRAERRRREFRRSLSGWLNILTLALASGQMLSRALTSASDHGQGWVFTMLRHTLADADQRGVTPWRALERAGDERGLDELSEVATSVNMAGGGAKVRATLDAKAAGMRARALADAHTEANEATTRMILPLVGIAFGFLLLVGYPAVSQIIGGG